RRAPGLVEDADKLLAKAQEEWHSKNLEESRRDALLGNIKLKTAIALVEQDQAKTRTTAAEAELRRTEDEYSRVNKDVKATSQEIALLKKRGQPPQQLSPEQPRATPTQKLSAAELALKTADTVDARTHAAAQYQAAADLIARAQAEVKAGNLSAAQT